MGEGLRLPARRAFPADGNAERREAHGGEEGSQREDEGQAQKANARNSARCAKATRRSCGQGKEKEGKGRGCTGAARGGALVAGAAHPALAAGRGYGGRLGWSVRPSLCAVAASAVTAMAKK